jgi:hypothetical protein
MHLEGALHLVFSISMTTDFISGLELSGLFYREIIKPILDEHFDSLQYSAALIGAGSEVLAFDTAMSRDHDWGPRLKLFLNESDYSTNAKAIEEVLRRHLPDQFRGVSVQWLISGPTNNHCVELLTIRDFFLQYLNFDLRGELSQRIGLLFPNKSCVQSSVALSIGMTSASRIVANASDITRLKFGLFVSRRVEADWARRASHGACGFRRRRNWFSAYRCPFGS